MHRTIDLIKKNGTPETECLRQDLRARVPLLNTTPLVDRTNSRILARSTEVLCTYCYRPFSGSQTVDFFVCTLNLRFYSNHSYLADSHQLYIYVIYLPGLEDDTIKDLRP